MKRLEVNFKDLCGLGILFVVGLILMFLGLAFVGNKAEVFNDFIIETVAQTGTNETGELSLFWCILFLGIPLLLFLCQFLNKAKGVNNVKKVDTFIGAEIVVNVANVIFFLINGNFSTSLVMMAIILFVNYLINNNKQKEGIILPIIIYYFLFSLCAIVNYLGVPILFNSNILFIATFVLDIVIFILHKHRKIMNRTILCMQVFIPFLFLVYKMKRYSYQGQLVYYPLPFIANLFFYVFIGSMVLFACYQVYKRFKTAEEEKISNIVFVTTCLSIFVINSVSVLTSFVVPTDLHHTAEEVISFQQIFGKGQRAYLDYFPVSGLFPVFIGAILELFGGNITTFNLAHTIFMICFASITIFLVSRHLEKDDCLLIALLFSFPSYDRTVFILMSLLILMLPTLIRNRNLWLKVWIWLCFIGGVYYPSFGGAVLLGTLPFAILQVIYFFKEKEFKKKLKSVNFYLGWFICLFPIICSLPLLFHMAKHILLYSSQTNLADGISVFGQSSPEKFMPYLNHFNFIRDALYYALRYMIPIAVVWILVLIFSKCLKMRKIKDTDWQHQFLILTSSIITLIVTYMATIVRSDPNTLVSRPTHIIVILGGILFFLFYQKYMQKTYANCVLLGISFGIILILGCSGLTSLDSRFKYAYDISDDYEIISDHMQNKYPRLGQGFIQKSDIKMFDGYSKAYELLKYDKNLKFLAWGKLGVYYTLDLTTVGQPSLYAAKDYKTHQEIIDAIKEQKPVIGMDLSTSVLNYYLYHYLLTTDQYVYDSKYDSFLPIELFRKIYGNDETPTDKREISLYATDVGRVSNSLGKSVTSLEKVMQKKNYQTVITNQKMQKKKRVYQFKLSFDQNIKGTNADMLYIEFDTNKITEEFLNNQSFLRRVFRKQFYNDGVYVVASFGNGKKSTLLSIMGDGKLLIPLGTNVNWLLNEHNNITFEIKNVDRKIKIKKMQFYQLKHNR